MATLKLFIAAILVLCAFFKSSMASSSDMLFIGICILFAGWIAHNEK